MRAKEIAAEFHICEGCDKAESKSDNPKRKIRPGAVRVIEGWRDPDEDWIGDTDEYASAEEVAEDTSWDTDEISEASYLECPADHDSDDGWEIETFDKIYVCGVCHTRYTALRDAAGCCDEKENN